MDTIKLATLLAVSEIGSLSGAAERLGAQVSTVGRRISNLATAVGVPLLIRTGRGARLTPQGERFAERARLILREFERAIADARGETQTEVVRLRISAPPRTRAQSAARPLIGSSL